MRFLSALSILCIIVIAFVAIIDKSSVSAKRHHSIFNTEQYNNKQHLHHEKRAQRATTTTPNPAQRAHMFVSYCPSYFTNAIALVDVAPLTGAWSILGTAHLPSGVFGCSADYNPTFAADPNDSNILWFDFTSDTGYFVKMYYNESKPVGDRLSATALVSKNEFFTGFVNFRVRDSLNVFDGITLTVTQSGFCSDGCIGYGIQKLNGTDQEQSNPLPFRAIADDTSFVDTTNNIYYVQASHDLRATPCAPEQWMDCLLSIDTNTGALLKSVYNRNEHVYRFGNPSRPTSSFSYSSSLKKTTRGNKNINGPIVDAFVVGMNSRCNRSENVTSYAFATVDLSQSEFELISCVNTNIVIQEDPWVSSFSPSNEVFVTASGDADGEDPQFLSFDVEKGNVIVQTKLTGLSKKLDAKLGLIFVWALMLPPV